MSTAHQQAYQIIRDAIFSGEFGPGYHLKEEQLTERCATSRTPIRQAIRRLEREGLIVLGENRRSYVPDIGESEAEQSFDILAYLESHAASLAARRITRDEIDQLKEIQKRFDVEAQRDTGHSRPTLEINGEFHDAIHRASGSPLLRELISKASGVSLSLYIKHRITGDPLQASREHWQIVEALEERDEDLAGLLMKMHVESVRRVYRRYWANSASRE